MNARKPSRATVPAATRRMAAVAWTGAMLAGLALASCAGSDKASPRGAASAGFRPLITSDPASLDRLEKAARDCRLKGIRREGPDKWLSFDTPARAPRQGDPFRCFLKWTQEHPETPYAFVGNEADR